MFSKQPQFEFCSNPETGQATQGSEQLELIVTLNAGEGCFQFEWQRGNSDELIGRGRLVLSEPSMFSFRNLDFELETTGKTETDGCNRWPASVRAFLNRLRKQFPVSGEALRVFLVPEMDIGPAKAGTTYPIKLPSAEAAWKWLARSLQRFAEAGPILSGIANEDFSKRWGQTAAIALAHVWLGVSAKPPFPEPIAVQETAELNLRVTLDLIQSLILLEWNQPSNRKPVAKGWVRCTGRNELTWELELSGQCETTHSAYDRGAIHTTLNGWLIRFPARRDTFSAFKLVSQPKSSKPLYIEEFPFGSDESPWEWLEDSIHTMGKELGVDFSPLAHVFDEFGPSPFSDFEKYQRRLDRKEQKRAEEEALRRENMSRLAAERRVRDEQAAVARRAAEAKRTTGATTHLKAQVSSSPQRLPVPPVPVRVDLPPLEFQETSFPLADLKNYWLRERASLWWVSNQSDDLLCLPHCRIEQLDYQVRTALRVLGPLRGRALLSDEVGLGKTIEAGLVLKELLTRGMVKRFLVLTVPSLVDQWEEELNDKFGLTTVTTNQQGARDDSDKFWRENTGIIASLHTLKQPARLQIACKVHWDILIVDEAHYLRNRESQAWKAINSLPRHFLLLLTATPVQNSLEELYNLVTLLQPGQLPSPKEFRARFIDPKRPRQPREPEELRRLLGQVMIRNTRANAGINLPPRRAETVLFEPDEAERGFWEQWEVDFRSRLAQLNASQASLWGRLLLQAAGSSPAAWRDALEKFPDRAAARAWQQQAPLESSWRRKCELLQPLTRGEGGAVIFTQFLQTQAALAEELRRAGVETFIINGATPPPDRQPITEAFHQRGGALLLTHSGTEGRNLQFSHRLANFDLPWNPMEIEQRIGRLHRLGQRHPVRIYNFVQAGTLQEHLLQILQEKLNLFELVIGETGLVLGEKFSSDEFAEEVLRRWRDSEGCVAEAMAGLGEELAAARDAYGEVKKLDETLFAKDYELL